ncbi:unnamed protein product, partial [Scytosiphon promiscuus]
MDEVVRLKSRFVSSRPGEGLGAGCTGGDEAAARLVDGILRRKSFYFQQRSGKLDMRAIGRVDIDSVVRDVDIDTLQVHLENITFADVSEDDLRLYSDQCFLNLFRLSQLLLEYLLSVQDTLATSLEALAIKHSSIRKALDKGRAELHAASEQDRALKREIRQKRATIARYEQLLALPVPSAVQDAATVSGGSLHSCLTCGKMFTSTEFLQQHIVRKHTHSEGKAKELVIRDDEEKSAHPPQLRLFVQMTTGPCLDMMVQGGATVAQLRGYINSTAGFVAAGPSKRLLYRGVLLRDDQTLRESNIPTDSQLLLLSTEVSKATEGDIQGDGDGRNSDSATGTASGETAAIKQISTVVDLMRQQIEWSMRSEHGRREQDLGSAEALEARMRTMEASLPRRLEEFMEESVGGLKTSLRKALDDMEELHAKRSNAGPIQDDEDETRRQEEQARHNLGLSRLASLAADMERVSRENTVLLQELAKVKASQAAPNTACPAAIEPPSKEPETVSQESSLQQVSNVVRNDSAPPSSTDNFPHSTSTWELSFPATASRKDAAVVQVARRATCETVCESIAAQLDVADARVVLWDGRRGGGEARTMIPLEASSGELRDLYRAGFLELEVLRGHVLSDHVVDGLVDFYEQHVPVTAKGTTAVSRSMAEIDLAAKRRATVGRKGSGQGDARGLPGPWEDDGEDAMDHAEKQVETIRAQLSATLTGARLSTSSYGNTNDLSKSININIRQTAPSLGLITSVDGNPNGGGGIGDDDIFGDGDQEDGTRLVSRADLQRVVEERKRTRPAGIERQMESVSKSMDYQLNQLLEEAEEELHQLEEDSLGSATYSSTGSSAVETASASFSNKAMEPSHHARRSLLTIPVGINDTIVQGQAHQLEDEAYQSSMERDGNSRRSGVDARLEDQDVPKSDWGRTMDTAISIPEGGAEERADQHEANASRELEHQTISG